MREIMVENTETPAQLFFITPVRSPANIIQTASITLSGTWTVISGSEAFQYMFDSLVSTAYAAEVTTGATITFDFGQTLTVNSIYWLTKQRNASGDAGAVTRIRIQISADNVTYTDLFDHNQTLGANTTSAFLNDSTGRQTFRYMRLLATNAAAHQVFIYEIFVTALQ